MSRHWCCSPQIPNQQWVSFYLGAISNPSANLSASEHLRWSRRIPPQWYRGESNSNDYVHQQDYAAPLQHPLARCGGSHLVANGGETRCILVQSCSKSPDRLDSTRDIFTPSRWPLQELVDCHVWGSPV